MRLGDIVEVEILPVGDVGRGATNDVGERGVALFVHPVLQPRDHLLHDLEAVGHRRRADLHVAGAERHEFSGVAPGGDAADAGDRQSARFRIARDLGHHVHGDRLDRRAAIAAMRALAVDGGLRRETVEVDAGDGVDRVDQRDGIRSTCPCRPRRLADVGDVGRQLGDDGHARVLFAPAHDHLDVFRHLADRRAHAALAHAVRAAEIELDAVGVCLLDQRQDRLPAFLHARHHDRGDQRPIRPVHLHLLHLAQVGLQVAVGDQLDVVQAEQPAISAPDRAVARPVDVDDRRTLFAERLPDHAAPACLEGALDVVGLVGRRRRGQPERIGRLDADEIVADVCHAHALPLEVSARWMDSAASRP